MGGCPPGLGRAGRGTTPPVDDADEGWDYTLEDEAKIEKILAARRLR